jgi:hypothetical protein
MFPGVDFDGFKGMSPGNELDKCIGDLRKKVTEDRLKSGWASGLW